MSIDIVPFQPGHLAELDLQPCQASLAPYFTDPAYGLMLAQGGRDWGAASLRIDGRARLCAGLVPKWTGTLTAWAAAAHDVPLRGWAMAAALMRRRIAQALANPAIWRIETHVLDGWPPGHRLMQHLGFAPEGLHRGYAPDGGDHWIYARLCAPAQPAVTEAS